MIAANTIEAKGATSKYSGRFAYRLIALVFREIICPKSVSVPGQFLYAESMSAMLFVTASASYPDLDLSVQT